MKLLPGLASKTLAVWKREKAAETLSYFPSDLIKEDNELATHIRVCEKLDEKPGKDDDDDDDEKEEEKDDKPDDVFDSKYWGPLLVERFSSIDGEQFGFLLNMNAVFPLHSLIITKDFIDQEKPLSRAQLLAAYTVLDSLASTPACERDGKTRTGGGKFVSFFNCGGNSGYSQQHKHIQFIPIDGEDGFHDLPVERAARGRKDSEDEVFSASTLPYIHFISKLDLPEEEQAVADYLHDKYAKLLSASKKAIGKERPDYNLLMTHEHMHIIPRRQEGFQLPPNDGETSEEKPAATEPLNLSCNSIAYCGTMLVKSTMDAARLKEIGGVLDVLTECGYKKPALE